MPQSMKTWPETSLSDTATISGVLFFASARIRAITERVAGKGHHAFSLRPLGVAQTFVVLQVVRQKRRALLRDETNPEVANGHSGVFAIPPAKSRIFRRSRRVPLRPPASQATPYDLLSLDQSPMEFALHRALRLCR